MTASFSSTCKSNLRIWCHQAKRFELNAVSVAMIRQGIKLHHHQSAALNRSGVAMLRNQKNSRMQSKPSANLQRRYGYLEKAFDGDTGHCLDVNRLDRKISEAEELTGATLLKTTEVVPLRVAANRVGALRFRLVFATIISYLAMMAFLIHSARHATQTVAVAAEFSPAMIALGSCMAFSVIVTGLFVLVRHGD